MNTILRDFIKYTVWALVGLVACSLILVLISFLVLNK